MARLLRQKIRSSLFLNTAKDRELVIYPGSLSFPKTSFLRLSQNLPVSLIHRSWICPQRPHRVKSNLSGVF